MKISAKTATCCKILISKLFSKNVVYFVENKQLKKNALIKQIWQMYGNYGKYHAQNI